MVISRSPTARRSCTLPYSTHWPLDPLRNATSSSEAQAGVLLSFISKRTDEREIGGLCCGRYSKKHPDKHRQSKRHCISEYDPKDAAPRVALHIPDALHYAHVLLRWGRDHNVHDAPSEGCGRITVT